MQPPNNTLFGGLSGGALQRDKGIMFGADKYLKLFTYISKKRNCSHTYPGVEKGSSHPLLAIATCG